MDDALQLQIDAFTQCIVKRDCTLAEGVLDDGYELVLVHPTPAVMPRERWLDLLPDYVCDRYDEHDRTVAIDGDCATVLQRVEMSATVLGEDRTGQFVISDVWRRRPEGWRVWRRHSTPLSAGRMPGVEA